VVEAVCEVLDDFCKGILGCLALLDRQPPPRRIDAEEGVRDVLALHDRDATRAAAARAAAWAAPDSPVRLQTVGACTSRSRFGTRNGSAVGLPPIARPRFVARSRPGSRYSSATYEQSMSQVRSQHRPALSDLRLHGQLEIVAIE